MTADEITAARELVAMEGWMWRPGMRALHEGDSPRRICWVDTYPGGIPDGDARVRPDNSAAIWDAIPDTDDLPTRYALLGIVREVWPDAHCWRRWLSPSMDGDCWCVTRLDRSDIMSAPTESLALIRTARRALEG